MPTFDIAACTAIENWLANQGDPWKADAVHYAMRERELLLNWRQMPFLRWLWKWAYFCIAGSGTRVQSLLRIHLLLFLFSWLAVFSNPGSVEHPSTFTAPKWKVPFVEAAAKTSDKAQPSRRKDVYEWVDRNGAPQGRPWAADEQKEWNKTSKEQGQRADDEWMQWDGFWVALNVQLPLIHLWARDAWQPASQDGYFGTWFGVYHLLPHMQYETFASLIQLFSYLTLPMLIASLGRAFKRREEVM